MDDPATQRDPLPSEPLGRLARTRVVEHYRPPKLSILHLLIWIALAAVILSLCVTVIRAQARYGLWSSAGRDGFRVGQVAFLILGGLITATLLLGAGVILRDKWRGEPGPLQPGHWLVLVLSFVCSWALVATFILPAVRMSWSTFGTVLLFVILVGSLTGAAVALMGTNGAPNVIRWQTVLGLLSGVLAIFGVMPLAAFAPPFAIVLLLPAAGMWLAQWIALRLAIYYDRRDGIRRDGLHWLGVAMLLLLWLGLPAMTLLMAVIG